ncbi:MAG: hypothetical protein PHT19_16150 [Methylococcus sp.]|nr:hypothetical protein [Methylococcus sp.]
MISVLVALGIAVWFFQRALVRKRNPGAAVVFGLSAYYFIYMIADWGFRLIYGGTVHHYDRYTDGTVEAVAIVAGGLAAVTLGLVLLVERRGSEEA